MRSKRLLARVVALERRPGIADPMLIVVKLFRHDGPAEPDRRLTPREEVDFAEAKSRGQATFVIRRPVRMHRKEPPYDQPQQRR